MWSADAITDVIHLYPGELARGRCVALGNAGGFSGARLWRIEPDLGAWCLKAWPPGMTAKRLTGIHRWMTRARQADLPFVPAILPLRDGRTCVQHGGVLWDVEAWMPGEADLACPASPARIAAACEALARLHRAWAAEAAPPAPCPAVRRRLDSHRQWLEDHAAGWRPTFSRSPLDELGQRAWFLLALHMPALPAQLGRWLDRPMTLHPCLCDVWNAHVLFEGDEVTGLIDHGSAKLDHASADLARLLGSTAGDDAAAWSTGLDAYARVRPLADDEAALARLLDRTGTVVGLFHWMVWLYRERRQCANADTVAARLQLLLTRVERWG